MLKVFYKIFINHIKIELENGDLYSFGNNYFGQLGRDKLESDDNLPTKILNNKNIKSIVLGEYHSFYLESNFSIYFHLIFDKIQENGDLYGCGNQIINIIFIYSI